MFGWTIPLNVIISSHEPIKTDDQRVSDPTALNPVFQSGQKHVKGIMGKWKQCRTACWDTYTPEDTFNGATGALNRDRSLPVWVRRRFTQCFSYVNAAVGCLGNDLHLVLVKSFINESDYQLMKWTPHSEWISHLTMKTAWWEEIWFDTGVSGASWN